MGTPDFAAASLRKLHEEGAHIVAVVTMPDKPAGRGMKVQESPVKKYAVTHGLTVLQPEKLKSPDFIEQLNSLRPDLGIVVAFRMLPEIVWKLPRLGTFNLHASLLPQYRGAAPIHWAIINGEKETGVTTFFLKHEIDTGDIIAQRKTPIGSDETTGELYQRLMKLGAELVWDTVKSIGEGTVDTIPQATTSEVRLAPKIFKEDARIRFSNPSKEVYNFIRGMSPMPCAWTKDEKGNIVKIFRADHQYADHQHKPGTVFYGTREIKVACGGGYILPKEIQTEGRKVMPIEEWIRGNQVSYFE